MNHVSSPIIAVTGANGWVGGRIVDALARKGFQVRRLVRCPRLPGDVPFELGRDVTPDALQGVSVLVHAAYDFTPVTWNDISKTNVEGSEKLFKAARDSGVSKIVFISSMSAFEGCRSLYGKAKLAIEEMIRGGEGLVLRPGLVYGEQSGGMFGNLVRQVQRSKVIPLFGKGDQKLYLIHEADLGDVVCKYVCREIPECAYPLTITHEAGWNFRNILLKIATDENKQIHFISIPWRLVWMVLKAGEIVHMPIGFRSDSLVSLMNQNPNPDFSFPGKKIEFRSFEQWNVKHFDEFSDASSQEC